MKKLICLTTLLLTSTAFAQPVANMANSIAWDNPNAWSDTDRFEVVVFDALSRQVGLVSTATNVVACATLAGTLPNGTYSLIGYVIGRDGQRSDASTNFVFAWIGAPQPPSDIPPTFTQQPSNVTVKVGEPIVLTCKVEGTLPIQYQWFRNGAAIPGATNPVYSAVAATSLAGAYSVQASNVAGTKFSFAALVSVKGPPNPPGGWKVR